jgi:hypothetical protein
MRSDPLNAPGTYRVDVIATDSSGNQTPASRRYTYQDGSSILAPRIEPPGNQFRNALSVSIIPNQGTTADLRWLGIFPSDNAPTDWTDPRFQPYTGPILIQSSAVFYAYTLSNGVPSPIASKGYYLRREFPEP